MDKDTSFPQKNTLVLGGRLYETSPPLVAGILNVTPDSFYDGGNYLDEREIVVRLEQMASGGADIIDVGAFSSRPGAAPVPEEEEWRRLEKALRLAQKHAADTRVGGYVPGLRGTEGC